MRTLAIALCSVAAIGFAVPLSTSANADVVKKTVIIKHGGHHDHGRHRGWYQNRGHHHHGYGERHGHSKKVVTIKQRRFD